MMNFNRTIGGDADDSVPDPLQDARALHARIKRLRDLLDFQRLQIEAFNARLYSDDPSGVAVRRLLALKQSMSSTRPSHSPDDS
jgi:hypothetical protein